MEDKLAHYRSKRRFAQTPEPGGGETDANAERSRFVIQEHHATRLHWDLRLERDGVLASWAVPNGIPVDPAHNRKAVHTEDHPLEYIDFHGEIPAGNYGAGTMTIWDQGTYECHKWRPEEVMVTFHGKRVNGRYVLFRAGSQDKDWMIHRMDPPDDPDRIEFPSRLLPMLARAGQLPAPERDWGFEVKWDGVRALAYSQPGRLRLESRNANDITARYPELKPLNRALSSHEVVLDGEVVAMDEEGRPSFERLQHRMHLTGDAQVRRRSLEIPVVYVIFDLLFLDGHLITEQPYEQRRAALDQLALAGTHWQVPRYIRGEGTELLEVARQRRLEGIVAKRLDSAYEPGRRSSVWLKIKVTRRQELVIAGWLPGAGRRLERIGALLTGYYEQGSLRFAGKVGTGFTEQELDRLARLLVPLQRPASPFDGRQPQRGAVFCEPRLVAEIEFTEWTGDGMLRHPSYKGLRDDKSPQDVRREPEDAPDKEEAAGAGAPLAAATGVETAAVNAAGLEAVLEQHPQPIKAEVVVDGRSLHLSNLAKPMYPAAGFTKGDVIDYYRRIAPALLPHLRDRPLTLKRYPDGVQGPHFYEKQCPKHRPDWVRTAAVAASSKRNRIDFCIVDDLPTLIWTSNLADLELHTSLSVAVDVTRPTMMVFDLDPGPPAALLECCQVALWLRGMFEGLGLQCFPKTSGSKGLQIYVPLNGDATYEQTKPFARAVAEILEKGAGELVVSRMTKSLRAGKVLIDWSQNDEHKTTACVYSLRAKERPTVSTPLSWDEVQAAVDAGDAGMLVFEARDVLERVEGMGDLFAPVLTLRQQLPTGA
ncbi:MAG: DNA ligase D [Actinomycetota bacterium]|nr:DNA ligase D [Actinomycetota bacterium]